jgi:hypothetical protein
MNIIGWRSFPKGKKRHLFKWGNGHPYQHCYGSTPNDMHVEGRSTIEVNVENLLMNVSLPKCKKCLKEEKRLKRIGAFRV